MNNHQDTIYRIFMSRNGDMLVSTSRDSTVRFWNLNNYEEIREKRIDILN